MAGLYNDNQEFPLFAHTRKLATSRPDFQCLRRIVPRISPRFARNSEVCLTSSLALRYPPPKENPPGLSHAGLSPEGFNGLLWRFSKDDRVHIRVRERDRQAESMHGPLRRLALVSYLKHPLHLSRSLRGRTLTHSSIADAGVRYAEIGVIESVEHLDSEL